MSLNSFGRKLRTGPLGAIFFVIVVLCVGVLAFTGLGSYINNRQHPVAATQAPSDIVAKVNGTPVSVAQFQSALQAYQQQYESYGPTPSITNAAQSRVAAFTGLCAPIFEADVAKADGITASADEIAAERTKELAPIKSELGLPSSASESDVENALQPTGHSIDDLLSSTAIQTTVLAQKYEAYLSEKNQASEEMVQSYYQQSRIRHILIDNRTRPDAQASALAADLISRLNKGADFVTLVKQYSDDPSTKNKGGDDGWIDQSSPYPPVFKTAALALKPGQVDPTPIQIPNFGYLIIQSVATRSNLPKDYQKNHQQYVTQVTNALVQQEEQSDLAAAKASAVLVSIDPRLRADIAVSNAQQGSPNYIASLQSALKDYNTALASADDSEKAEIYASESNVYQLLNQPSNEMTAILDALGTIEDSQLRMNLGDLYKQKGDFADAIKQYETASDHCYDNPDIHTELTQDFQQLKQPALVAKETAWLKGYYARQKQANAQMPSGLTPQQ